MTMQIFHYLIDKNGLFPNNSKLPLLYYQQVFASKELAPDSIENTFKKNNWKNFWRNGVYNFHHYHSNTHEVLAIYSGVGTLEFGGEQGMILEVSKGDVVVIPVGVSHRSQQTSADFKCIGGYPYAVEYNMNYGKAEDHPKVDDEINQTPLPELDPVFGRDKGVTVLWKSNG